LREQVDLWRKELPAASGITVEEQIEGVFAYVDERQWISVFQQLLSNARFALATGGTLQVRLRSEELAPERLQELGLADPNVIRIEFQDNGFGMPGEVLDRAFEPFFTTRTQAKAAGLGLTIVHSVTKWHCGQVLLESSEDQGTRIIIWVPSGQNRELAMERLRRETYGRPSEIPSAKILLVEPDPLIREVIRGCLHRTGSEVHWAPSAEEAIKVFESWLADWVLVLVEARIGSESGVALLHVMREKNPWIKGIVFGQEAQAESGGDSSFFVVLKKPFTLKAFNDLVKQHLPQAK
jgi:two-component system cell cycle sensor histidine kinase/response regulator CckA